MAESENRVLEILIKFGLDPTQARAAVREMDVLDRKARRAGRGQQEFNEQVQKSDKRARGLSSALQLLGTQFGELGRVGAYAAIGTGITLPVLAAAAGVQLLVGWISKMNAAIDQINALVKMKSVSAGVSEVADAAERAATSAEDLATQLAALKTISHDLDVENADAIALLHDRADAADKVADAEQKVALATLASKKATMTPEAYAKAQSAITGTFGAGKESRDLQLQKDTIAAEQKSVKDRERALMKARIAATDLNKQAGADAGQLAKAKQIAQNAQEGIQKLREKAAQGPLTAAEWSLRRSLEDRYAAAGSDVFLFEKSAATSAAAKKSNEDKIVRIQTSIDALKEKIGTAQDALYIGRSASAKATALGAFSQAEDIAGRRIGGDQTSTAENELLMHVGGLLAGRPIGLDLSTKMLALAERSATARAAQQNRLLRAVELLANDSEKEKQRISNLEARIERIANYR
jgi:hypothetical protein